MNGLIGLSYVANTNRPASRLNQFRVFDVTEGSVTLDEVEFVAQKSASASSRMGFRVDLTFGSSVSKAAASAGLFRDADGDAGDLDIHQAYISYLAPAGQGLRLDIGKFITHVGCEVLDGYDGYNDNHSRSLLFGLAEPFTHTGVRASYAFAPAVSVSAALFNGWDDAVDNNRAKSVGLQLALTPSPRASLTANYIGGAEQPGDSSHMRHLIDFVAVGKPTPTLTLTASYDYGREAAVTLPASAGGGVADARWSGVAGYARQAVTDAFALIVRGEWFDDPQGARSGHAQTLREVTFTPEFRATPQFIIRGDVRRDWSTQSVFERHDGSLGTSQFTVSLNVLYVF